MDQRKETWWRATSPVLLRGGVFFVLWLVLAGTAWPEVAAGLIASGVATFVSCRLVPGGGGRWSLMALVRVGLGFVWQSIVAGVDVAWRAMQPRMPLDPGFVEVRIERPEGINRTAFLSLSSLMPGTLPTGLQRDDVVEFHCLDVRQPVAVEIAAAERRFAAIWSPP